MSIPQAIVIELHTALDEMHYAINRGAFGNIGFGCTNDELKQLNNVIPSMPVDIIEWYKLCGYATFASAFIYGPRIAPSGLSIFSLLDHVAENPARIPLAADQFGCIYCIDIQDNYDNLSTPVFLTEFASHETINYHIASSFSKFLKLISKSLVTETVNWYNERSFYLDTDPAIEDIPGVILPWEV